MPRSAHPHLYDVVPKLLKIDQLRARAIEGMGAHRPLIENAWGPDFDAFLDYLAYATAPAEHGLALLEASIAEDPSASTVVIGGEYSGGKEEDGADSPIIAGAVLAAEMLAKNWTPPTETVRNLRTKSAFIVVMTGGIRGLEHFGEFPGDVMLKQFNNLTAGAFAGVGFADLLGINTGVQAWVLAGYIQAMNAKRVVVTLPIEHVARFAATIACALQKLPISATPPTFYFVSPGCEWDHQDPYKLNLTRSDLAFGPVVMDEKQSKPYGGEYTDLRYQKEQNPEKNQNYACAALSPADMRPFMSQLHRSFT